MRLLVDIGNSRFKWQSDPSSHKGGVVHDDQSLSGYLDKQWAELKGVKACWACSVADGDVRRLLDDWCLSNFGFKVHWVESKSSELGVVSLYENPKSLGSDRWMALIGARHKYPNKPLCIVDAGTAITVDAMSELGHFLGGTIIPGRKLMQQALGHNTAQLPDSVESANIELNVQAKTTLQAIGAGVELTLQAGVARLIQEHLIKFQRKMKIIVTGGDAHSIYLPYADIVYEPDLVFEGLKLIANKVD